MASSTRDTRVVAAVACPRCGARAGEVCRNPVPHDRRRGAEDRRAQPARPHSERRAAWTGAREPRLQPLSAAAAAARAPRPPAELVDARHDKLHCDSAIVRRGRTRRAARTDESGDELDVGNLSPVPETTSKEPR